MGLLSFRGDRPVREVPAPGEGGLFTLRARLSIYGLVPAHAKKQVRTSRDSATQLRAEPLGKCRQARGYEPTCIVPLSVSVKLPGGGGGAALRAVPTIVTTVFAYCDRTVKLLAGPAAH